MSETPKTIGLFSELIGPVKIVKSLKGASPITEGPFTNWRHAAEKLGQEGYAEVSNGNWRRYAGRDETSEWFFTAVIKSLSDPS